MLSLHRMDLDRRTDDGGLHFTGNASENLQRKETELFPPELLGMLSDLHYIGSSLPVGG